jgi:ATP-binding cassette subfamily C exporter for protease/lipase
VKPPAALDHALGHQLWSLRRAFLAVAVFSGVANLLLLTPTIYMLQVYDRVMVSQSELTLLAVSIITLFLFAAMAFAEGVRSRVLVRVGVRLDRELATRVFRASFEASLAQGPQAQARPFQDLLQVRQFLTGSAIFAFLDAPWVPIYLAVCFFLHPLLGACAVLFALLQGAVAWLGHQRSAAPAAAVSQAAADAQAYVQGKFRHVETLEAMGMMAGLRRRWQQRHATARGLNMASTDQAQRVASASKLLRYAQQSLTLGVGALLVIDGQLTPGAMIASNVLVARALAPIDMIVANWRGFVATRAGFHRLRELLEAYPAAAEDGPPRPRPAGALELRGLVATAPGRPAPLLQANLEIAAGETVVVLGPSGSGKSTLARCLLGVWPHTQGEVLLDGEPLSNWTREARGPHFGYLPQDVELFDGTIADNIARMGVPDPARVIAAARATGLHDAILRLPKGYDTPIGDTGGQLSGGQRQRLALARALYGDPAVVVLDEPNASLDEAGEAALARTLAELRAQRRTLVLITHRQASVQLADRVLLLRDGEVLAYGPPAAVLPARPAVASRRGPAALPA